MSFPWFTLCWLLLCSSTKLSFPECSSSSWLPFWDHCCNLPLGEIFLSGRGVVAPLDPPGDFPLLHHPTRVAPVPIGTLQQVSSSKTMHDRGFRIDIDKEQTGCQQLRLLKAWRLKHMNNSCRVWLL
uniref:Secreted protein n=1 Tax=Micrurus spixii TaxID=129469 RepID=A0A2D4LJ38_9SAUR